MLWDAPSASGTQKEKAATQFCGIRNLEVLQNTPVTLAPPPPPLREGYPLKNFATQL